MYNPAHIFSAELAYIFYFLAVGFLFLPIRRASLKKFLWLSTFCVGLAIAKAFHRVENSAVLVCVIFGAITYAYYRLSFKLIYRILLGIGILIFSLLLGMHFIPGFHNFQMLSRFPISEGAAPFQFFLNLDKPVVGLFLIGWGHQTLRSKAEWKRVIRQTLPVIFSATILLLGIPWILGYLKLDLKWYPFTWIWLASNLFFTSVTEEAFFRGFLQKEGPRVLQSLSICKAKSARFVAWVAISVIFGLLHLKGGVLYASITAAAGLLYGYAYLKTERIEASILTHFAVNAIHFLTLTYPSLR
jgi:membrane protease YdiL (CAAX protease family)